MVSSGRVYARFPDRGTPICDDAGIARWSSSVSWRAMSLLSQRFPIRLLVTGALLALLVSCERQAARPQVQIGKFREVGAFTFTDQQSHPRTAEDLKGKVWIANFIFTSCAAECLVLSSRFAELQRLFAKEDDLAFVSFSVDP